jgi:lambda family phage tail tape measure protein
MEREATEFRRSVEDQVFGKRQELEQKLIENERKRQQNTIDAFDLQLQKASTGLDPIAQGVVNAARDYLRIRAEGEADLQQAEKQLKLELQKIDQEVSRYKLQVEDRVSQMAIQRDEFSRDVSRARLQIERQIVDHAVQAEDYRLAMAKYRYEVEIDLEKKKQIVVQNGLENAAIQASAIRQAVQATNGTGASRLPGSISDRLDASGQNGADMPVALNNIMRSYHNGIVTEINKAGNNGNYVVVQFLDDLGNKLEATYSHVAAAVKVGQSVVGGQTIGRFDASGRTFGAHNSIDINSPGTNGALQRNRETAAARRSADMLVRGQVQGVVSGIKPDTDTYLQPGVGYFSRKTGRMVKGLTTGAGQATSVGASPQAAMGAASTVGAAPVFKGTMTMPGLPGAPRLVGINDLLQQYLQLVEKVKAATVGATAADKQRFAVQSEAARFALEQQTLAPILQYTEQNRELEFEIQKRKERNRLALEGVAPEITEGELRILEIRRDLNSVLKGLTVSTNQAVKSELERLKLNPSLVDSTFALTEATLAGLVATTEDTKKQEELRAKLQAILDLRNQLADKARGQAETAAEGARGVAKKSVMSPSEKIDEKIGKLKEELAELTNVGNIAITVADGIGNAFSQAFQGLISGSMSAQEALSSFFKGVASAFLSMAAEIIAKQMAMIVLQTILRALGAVSWSGGGSAVSAQTTPSNWGDFSFTPPSADFAANGAYFANGTAAFANGGAFTNSIVSSPTLFRFADGGVTKTGEMGEAGPEAIMPLRRGPGGRLGVDASGLRAAMGPAPGSSGASPVLSMSFETTNYGGTEYVSREQLELAMAETKKAATKDGANRGMTMTLDRIKNSGSIRRRIGV